MVLVRASYLAAAAIVCLASVPALSAELRCGWYENPTPGNLMLTDKDGMWWITSQMQFNGPDAADSDKAPSFDTKQYVQTQANGYGYGCACLTVATDPKDKRITRVYSGSILPIARCKQDRSLPGPSM
jgi:hypothetical protein